MLSLQNVNATQILQVIDDLKNSFSNEKAEITNIKDSVISLKDVKISDALKIVKEQASTVSKTKKAIHQKHYRYRKSFQKSAERTFQKMTGMTWNEFVNSQGEDFRKLDTLLDEILFDYCKK